MSHDPQTEIAALRASRDEAYERVAAAEHQAMRLAEERDHAERRVRALLDQIEAEGCTAAHLGERTYECALQKPCGLCRLRDERDALAAQVVALRSAIDGLPLDDGTKLRQSLALTPTDAVARIEAMEALVQCVRQVTQTPWHCLRDLYTIEPLIAALAHPALREK